MGHIVGKGLLKPNPQNTEKVMQCRLLETLTEVRSFCNLAGFYRKFIHNFAKIAKPLTDLMGLPGKRKKIQLSDEAIKAFHTLKEAICSKPILNLPDMAKPFGIRTDSSDYAIGGVLFQKDDKGNEKPICYASRTLTKTEQRYSTSEREMLAIYYWIRYWRLYLWGTHFQVFTDHSPLIGVKTKKDITRRLTRMILNLQEYDFELHYTPGRLNIVADALSRAPLASQEIPIKEITQMLNTFSSKGKEKEDDPMEQQVPDETNTELFAKVQSMIGKGAKEIPNDEEELKQRSVRIHAQYSKANLPYEMDPLDLAQMQAEDETLERFLKLAHKKKDYAMWIIHKECLHKVRARRSKREKSVQLVLPTPLREDIMRVYHDEILGGHCGYLKTFHKIAQWYWWPNMQTDIKNWVKECTTCQAYAKVQRHKMGKMAPIIVRNPFEVMGMDIVTGLPSTSKGNRSIIVFTDYYTKWVEAFAIPDETALMIAKKLIKGILSRHGAPKRIISDRGTQFTSDLFREVTDLLGMKQSMTSGYYPQADGQAERTIGTLVNMLAKLSGSNQNDWDLQLPYALWAYRTSVHATTKETPFFLVYGRHPTNPADIRIRQWVEEHKSIEDYTLEVANRLIKAQERVIDAINKAKAYDKQRFDKDKVEPDFKKGDIVWLERETSPSDTNRKLDSK